MEPFVTFRGRVAVLPVDNIDTDQIFPARFLRVTTKDGLEEMLFADWRLGADGKPRPDFPLNRTEAAGASVLLAGENFGAGSSREHAVWALMANGFRAVIARSFADIFRANALKNGLLPIALDAGAHQRLVEAAAVDPATEVEVHLAAETLRLPDGTSAPIVIDAFSRRCLLEGMDELGYLLSHGADIAAYEASHPGRVKTTPDR